MARRFMRLNRKQIRIGVPAALFIVAGLWGYSMLPLAWGNPELHRGWEQPVLSLAGKRYSVSYTCKPGNRRHERPGMGTMLMKSFAGRRFNQFLAWNHDDAIRFAASVEPDCRIVRLNYLTRRYWGKRTNRRRYISHPVIGPEV